MFLSQATGVGRKQINLGGQRGREEDRNRFLQRTEQERQLRLLDKKKNASATRIQSFYRARCAVHRQKETERGDWEQKMAKMQMLPPALASAVPIFFPLLRQFLYFYSPSHPADAGHFQRMCQLVLTSTKNKEPANYFTPILKDQTRLGWLVATKRLARICVQRLVVESSDAQAPSPSLRLLLTLCNAAEWSLGGEDVKSVLASRILVDLMSHGFFESIHRTLVQVVDASPLNPKDGQDAGSVLLALVSLALLPFQNIAFVAASPTASRRFTLNVLSVPRLVRHLPVSVIQSLVSSFPSSLSITTNDFDTKQMDLPKAILNNLLDLVNSTIQQHNVQISTAFLEAVSRLLDFFTQAFTASNAVKKMKSVAYLSEDNMDLEEELEGEPEEDRIRENPVLQQVAGLISPAVLQALFKVFLPTEPPSPTTQKELSPFRVVFPRGLIGLCQLCQNLLADEHPTRMSMLNALAHTIVTNVWRLLTSTIEFHEFVEKGVTGPMEEVSSVLGLFCLCYSHVLVSLDDEEFFKRQTCFSLKEVLFMSLALKKVVFRMYWVKGDRDVPAVFQNRPLRKAITAVLQQLYDRNSRHVYCNEHHWSADEIALNTAQFEVDVMAGHKRALRILKHIPFLVPADMRFRLFTRLVAADKESVMEYRTWGGETRVTIRRDFVFEDGYAALAGSEPEKLKGVVKVSFVNSEGLPEAGIDGGGVFKEFLTELTKKAFGPEYGLFLETPDRLLYPNPHSHHASENHLGHFDFLGRVIGKAMYEGILVEVPFANFFLAKLLSKFNYYNDLVFLDPELHRNMMILKHYDGNVEEDFSLNFTVTNNVFGAVEVKELVPGGRDIPVTNENRIEYIHRVAHYRLNTQIRRQCAAFLRGFSALIKPEWLRMFNQHELHLLIAGRQGGIDLIDLRQHVQYGGGYHDDHPAIHMLWEVLQTFSVEDQHLFLKFVTSCSRPPLLGFGHLNPPFAIHKAGGSDRTSEHLPTASTCMNLLKIFPYKSPDVMRQKLLYAIRSAAGFELS